jgi:thiol-disulfide isomerase/thioredoxin
MFTGRVFLERSAWAFVRSSDVCGPATRPSIALLWLLSAVLISWPPSTAAAQARDDSRADIIRLTRQFASLDVQDLEGRRWTAPDLRGRIVILDFWATWCAPCLAEIPTLREVRRRYARDRLEILGVSLDVTDRRTLRAWLNRNRIDWPQVWDDRGYDGAVAEQFGVVSLPTSLLIDTDGTVVAINLRGERLLSAVTRLMAASSAHD